MSCEVRRRDGTRARLVFPGLVEAAQPVAGFSDLATISHEAATGVRVELAFAGEAFEMEDQRNWIDASFKIYGTPLSAPFPVEVPIGTRVRQEVLLRLVEEKSTSRAKPNRVHVGARIGDTSPTPVAIRLVDEITKLPEIGLGTASHGQLLSAREIGRLRSLRPGHVRVDLEFDKKAWEERLSVVLRNAESLDCPLELALHLTDEPRRDLADLAEALTRSRFPSFGFLVRARAFRRIIVLSPGGKTTAEASLSAARTFLRGMDLPLHELSLGGGTAADFCQLNQFRPTADGMDFICWSMNPQVHSTDSTSIAETPEAVPAQIASAKAFFRGAPLVVSPITLKPRFNPVATGPAAIPTGRALPPEVDPRQLSLFSASWTLAMLKALAESGAHSVTFFETTGWQGVMETETGSPLPKLFPSTPGMVFPLYHVLADVGEFCGGEIVTTESDDPSSLVSLYLANGPRRRLLLTNLGAVPLRVAMGDFSGFNLIRHLNATSRFAAMNSPETFRSGAGAGPVDELILAPCDYATLDSPEP
jgi:D-apionolactonase